MNNFKGCVPCVCLTGSGRKRSCEEQNTKNFYLSRTLNKEKGSAQQLYVRDCSKHVSSGSLSLKLCRLPLLCTTGILTLKKLLALLVTYGVVL